MRSTKHIRPMNRATLGSVAATTLMAVAGVLVWLFWLGDPCLGTTIANHWTMKDPSTVSPTPPADSGGAVVIENPYGIKTCDYWPTPADEALSTAAFAIVVLAIGWLAARRIRQRPLLAAAAITLLALSIAVSLQYWARWDDLLRMELLRSELFAMAVYFLAAVCVAMLGAWIAIRFTRRA